jgi:RNA polymerase sigma-70 factor (ECF subfamily)
LREYLLVLRCQTGDEAAFSDLFDRFSRRTLRYLEGLLGSDAADAQQEVWLAVFRGISKLSNPGAFRTWLYQTTRHRAIDVLRRQKRQSELLDAVRIEESGASEEHSELFLEPWDRPRLEIGLAELSAAHREVLLLRYWEEMSYADIALISGCSVGTVRSRLFHAKGQLRNVLHRLTSEAGRGSPNKRNEGGQ